MNGEKKQDSIFLSLTSHHIMESARHKLVKGFLERQKISTGEKLSSTTLTFYYYISEW